MRLIERGTHSLRLTEEGGALHARTEGLLSEIAEIGDAKGAGVVTPRGRLRVSASVVFAHVVLGRIASRFANTYPDVQLEIVAEDRMVNPVDLGYDLVIRINPAPDELLVGRCIVRDENLLVASPAIPRPAGPLKRAGAVPIRAVIRSSESPDTVWRIRDIEVTEFRPEPALYLSSLLMVRDAVLAGVGVAVLPRLMVADELLSGRLVSRGTAEEKPAEIWALHSSRRLVSAKIKAFLRCLDEAFPDRVFIPMR